MPKYTPEHPWFETYPVTDIEIFDDKYFIAQYRVLFGFRVLGGYIEDCGNRVYIIVWHTFLS